MLREIVITGISSAAASYLGRTITIPDSTPLFFKGSFSYFTFLYVDVKEPAHGVVSLFKTTAPGGGLGVRRILFF